MTQIQLNDLPGNTIGLPVGESLVLNFGQLYLAVSHFSYEWRTESNYALPVLGRSIAVYKTPKIDRFVLTKTNAKLDLAPLLADRPIVSRPFAPITVFPGNKTTIYISTPIWLALSVDKFKLRELPSVMLSDTWFGANTRSGELCYSSTTRARLDPDMLENDQFKAITPLVVANSGQESITLERISVPVPYLTLYRSADNNFVTSKLLVELEDTINNAKLSIKDPEQVKKLKKVADARQPLKKKIFYHALDLLFA